MDITSHGVWPRDGTEYFVVSLKQSTQKGTLWLSANASGGMGSETQNSTDEKFVIVGYTKKCRVQRLENFQLGHGYGYLRAHHLPTDRHQADITADGSPSWTQNETTFYLGLFYD